MMHSDILEKKMSDLKIINGEYKQLDIEVLIKGEHIGERVSTFGWIQKTRKAGAVGTFMDITSGFHKLKCLYPERGDRTLTFSTSISVQGIVVENPRKDRDGHKCELHIHKYTIYGGKQAPPFPVDESSQQYKLLEEGHLALRLPGRAFFLRARSMIMKFTRDCYYDQSFIEITPPTIVRTQVEGGSTLFELDYFGHKVNMTQSSQLYLETVVPVAHRAFCIMPSYRAEKSNTIRHLTEYTHVEAELADITFQDLLDHVQELVYTLATNFYAALKEDIVRLYPDFTFKIIPEKFQVVRYSDAIKFLIKKQFKTCEDQDYLYGDDLTDSAERFLLKEVGKGKPLFITHFPVVLKPFYMKKDPESPIETLSFDLLLPGVGEVVGGSMRIDNYDELIKGFERGGIDPEPYKFYTDMAQFGPCSHGGYGLGLERLIMVLMDYKNVNLGCLYPRFVSRCTP